MKKRTILALVVLVALISAWFFLSLRSKQRYDRLRQELANAHYAEIRMDQQTETLLQDVESHWTRTADVIGGPDAEIVKLAGMFPNVCSLICVLNYQMPNYSWFSLARNRKAVTIGLLKANFFPVSIDKTFHVSDDGHLAFLWCRTNIVIVYRDETNGLRATGYVRKRSGNE